MKLFTKIIIICAVATLCFPFLGMADDGTRKFEGDTLVPITPIKSTYHFKPYEVPDSWDCEVRDEKGKVIATLNNVYAMHFHPFELHGQSLYWIERIGVYQNNPNWTDELWVENINSGEKEKLYTRPGLAFSASPDERYVALDINDDSEVYTIILLDRKTHQSTKISKNRNAEVLGWSHDSKWLWFGFGEYPELRDELDLYTDGKIASFKYPGEEDEAINFDHGWLVQSEYPFCLDSDCDEEEKPKHPYNTLVLTDVFTGQRTVIAKSKSKIANLYSPHWVADKLLYDLDGRKGYITTKKIQSCLEQKAPICR